jgi:plasmid stabilization system protein ParE
MAPVRWTPQAADDLDAIAEFIARDSPLFADGSRYPQRRLARRAAGPKTAPTGLTPTCRVVPTDP